MKTIYCILSVLLALATTSCKKDADENYFYGTWSVREQQFSSADTTYGETLEPGVFTYTFKSGNSVHIVHTGITDVNDTWELYGAQQDSIRFSTGSSWAIQEKATGRFKAKFYPTANGFWVLTLEK